MGGFCSKAIVPAVADRSSSSSGGDDGSQAAVQTELAFISSVSRTAMLRLGQRWMVQTLAKVFGNTDQFSSKPLISETRLCRGLKDCNTLEEPKQYTMRHSWVYVGDEARRTHVRRDSPKRTIPHVNLGHMRVFIVFGD